MRTKLGVIGLLALLITFPAASQNQGVIGVKIQKSTSENWGKNKFIVVYAFPHFPADRAGIKPNAIISRVNGQAVDELSEDQVSSLLKGAPDTEVTLTVQQIGQSTPLDIKLVRQQPLPDNCFNESDLIPLFHAQLNLKGITVADRNEFCSNLEKSTIRDPEANFEPYSTFDFEYTSTDNPIQEKQLAAILQSKLEDIGLKRDKDNPDLLVFISFYSGNEKQYVPPTQKVYTRYKFGYDIWSGWGNKQYVESEQQGGYTEVTYLASLKVAFMDAYKAKEQEKVPPLVWQSEYKTTSSSEIDLLKVAENVFSWMIHRCYPVMDPSARLFNKDNTFPQDLATGNQEKYSYTGICYDKTSPNKVVYVYPESPAAKAGIQVGDLIVSVNNRIMPATQDELTSGFIYSVKRLIEKDKKITTAQLDDPKCKAGFTYVEDVYDHLSDSYTFEVKRNGSIQKIEVSPERRFYSWMINDDGHELFAVKETSRGEYERTASTKGGFYLGMGIKYPKNDFFYKDYISTKGGPVISIFMGQATSYRWLVGDEFSFGWFKMDKIDGYTTSMFDFKSSFEVGFMLFPRVYLTGAMGLDIWLLNVFDRTDNNGRSNEAIRFTLTPGIQANLLHGINLFSEYNYGKKDNSFELGLRFKLGKWK